MPKDVMCKNCDKLKNHWCKAVLDSPVEDMLRDCRHFRQKTNADRIRAMSDEELAKHFSSMICDINEGVEYHENPNRWLEWLKQTAKEE